MTHFESLFFCCCIANSSSAPFVRVVVVLNVVWFCCYRLNYSQRVFFWWLFACLFHQKTHEMHNSALCAVFFAYIFSHSDRFSYREPNWLVLLLSELTIFNVDLTHIHTWNFCFITYSNKQYKNKRTNKKARDNRVIDLIYLIAILWCVCKVLVVWYIVIKIVALKTANS